MDKKAKIKAIIGTSVSLLIVIALCVGIYIVKNKRNLTVANDSSEAENSTAETEDVIDDTSKGEDRHNIKVNITGEIKEEKAVSLVKEVYTLHYLYGINDFTDVNTLPVDPVVQYSFCKIYSDSIIDVEEKSKLKYREVLFDSMKSQVDAVFGSNNIDIKKSPLYNSKNNSFEMWQPVYKDNVYANANVNVSDGNATLDITFCGDKSLNTQRNVIKAEYSVNDGNYIIKSIQISK